MTTLYGVMMNNGTSDWPIVCELYNGFTTTTDILSEARRECREYRAMFPQVKYWVVSIDEVQDDD